MIVQLSSGVQYRGILACLDGFMNIAMEQSEEYVDGRIRRSTETASFEATTCCVFPPLEFDCGACTV